MGIGLKGSKKPPQKKLDQANQKLGQTAKIDPHKAAEYVLSRSLKREFPSHPDKGFAQDCKRSREASFDKGQETLRTTRTTTGFMVRAD